MIKNYNKYKDHYEYMNKLYAERGIKTIPIIDYVDIGNASRPFDLIHLTDGRVFWYGISWADKRNDEEFGGAYF